MRFFQLHELNVGEGGDKLQASTCLPYSYS